MGIWMMKIPLMDFEKKKNEEEDPCARHHVGKELLTIYSYFFFLLFSFLPCKSNWFNPIFACPFFFSF